MKPTISECLICSKPLGQESKDLDWRVCHAHRLCSVCGGEVRPIDVHNAQAKATEDSEPIEILHSRCAIASGKLATLSSDPTISLKQSTYNLLNSARLMVDPDMALSIQTNENNAMIRSTEFIRELLIGSMDYDKAYAHLKMLEACVANVSILIAKQDRAAIKGRADAREAQKFAEAKKQAAVSSKPTTKPVDDEAELALAKFMGIFNIKERKIGLEETAACFLASANFC